MRAIQRKAEARTYDSESSMANVKTSSGRPLLAICCWNAGNSIFKRFFNKNEKYILYKMFQIK